MQLVHDPRAHLHQSMSMPKQLPQIAVFRVGYSDPLKLCCRSFDYLESEIGGFAASVDELHSVAQHAIDQSS